MKANLDRAVLLFQQSRFDLAETELRQALLANPNDPHAHALLSLCLTRVEKLEDATEEARAAIGLAPDWAYTHYCLSRVLLARNRLAEAEAAAREAIELEPEDADYWAQLATIHMSQRQWKDALAAAEQGLSHNAEDAECANLRTMALAQLGRGADATKFVDETLARHPENAYSHAAKGWALLQQNKPKEALEHFRESLRLDPTLDFARGGMIEALKAHNPIYRAMLGYFLLMGRLSHNLQWAVVIGGWFGIKMLRAAAKANPALEPWFQPIILLYVVFVILTWFAVPLFNLLLRFNKYGRHALSRDQRAGSNAFAICLVLFLVGLAANFLAPDPWGGIGFLVAMLSAGSALPLVTIYNCDIGWPRKMMTYFAVAMVSLALSVFMLPLFMGAEIVAPIIGIFAMGFILTPWFANYLMMQTVRR